MQISGHSAIVTGGGSGLGEAVARELARQGAKVAVLDVNAANAERVAAEIGGKAVSGDITDTASLAAALDAAQAAQGTARIVMNIAGVGSARRVVGKDGAAAPLEDFERVVRINLIGTYNVVRLTAARIAKLAPLRHKGLLFGLCLLPFWVSELVRTLGWMIILRETGLLSRMLQGLGLAAVPIEFLYNDAAMLVGLVYTSLLFMVVPLVTTLDGLDDALIEAGYDLGGNGVVILREIVIPYAMPGIVSGSVVVFMLALGNYVAATLMEDCDPVFITSHGLQVPEEPGGELQDLAHEGGWKGLATLPELLLERKHGRNVKTPPRGRIFWS